MSDYVRSLTEKPELKEEELFRFVMAGMNSPKFAVHYKIF